MSRTRKQPYSKSKAFDRSCRSHGSCKYCYNNRTHSYRRRLLAATHHLNDYYNHYYSSNDSSHQCDDDCLVLYHLTEREIDDVIFRLRYDYEDDY